MPELITGDSANEVWEKAAELLLKEKSVVDGRTGGTYELLHTFLSIKDPKQKWVFNRVPPMSIAFALAELVWIMNGKEEAEVINFWNPKLKNYAGNQDIYYGAYGKRIRSHFGFDQIEKAYEALQNNPMSRQVVIQIYDVKTDFPIDEGKPRNADIPCNICSMLKIRNNELEWTQIMRSNDILLGLPYNFIQFMSLQEIVAGWLQIKLGTYNHFSDSLHLYERESNRIKIGSEPKIVNADSLALPKDESERIFQEIYDRMKILSSTKLDEKDIYSIARQDSEYISYNNMMLLITAYVARKKKMSDLTNEIMSLCTNKMYITMWNKWSNK